jgi:transketolase
MAQRALASAHMLAEEGIKCGVLHMHTVKPLDVDTLLALAGKVRLVVTVEEHTLIGGLGGAAAELFADHEWTATPPRLKRLGLPDRFLSDYGSQDFLLERCGLDSVGISATVRGVML